MKLGLIGGMGPLSTAYFYKRLLEYGNFEKDQDHLRVIIDSNSKIPDRSDHILNGKETFYSEIKKSRDGLIAQGCDVIVLLSSSAHLYFDKIVNGRAKYLNMVKIAMNHMKNKKIERLLIISTKATAKSKIYNKYSNGIEILYPTDEELDMIMDWIIKLKKGKKIAPSTCLDTINSISKRLGDVPVLIGCSELDRLFYDVFDNQSDIYIASDELIKKIYSL